MSAPGANEYWDYLSKTAEEMMEGAVHWDCPSCQHENIDWPDVTAMPMCSHCQESFDWQDVNQNRSE